MIVSLEVSSSLFPFFPCLSARPPPLFLSFLLSGGSSYHLREYNLFVEYVHRRRSRVGLSLRVEMVATMRTYGSVGNEEEVSSRFIGRSHLSEHHTQPPAPCKERCRVGYRLRTKDPCVLTGRTLGFIRDVGLT